MSGLRSGCRLLRSGGLLEGLLLVKSTVLLEATRLLSICPILTICLLWVTPVGLLAVPSVLREATIWLIRLSRHKRSSSRHE